MPADHAEVVGQDMAVECVAELSAECTAACSTDKRADGGPAWPATKAALTFLQPHISSWGGFML